MPSIEQVLTFREAMYKSSVALIQQKGHDYNRAQQIDGDTLFNMRVAEILGIVETAERGILVRLSDKFMRLISLMSPGVDAAVKDESVRDTVRDIHNYVDYALLMWEERQKAARQTSCAFVNPGWAVAPVPGQVYAVNEKLKDGSSPPPPDHINVAENKMGPGYVPTNGDGYTRPKI